MTDWNINRSSSYVFLADIQGLYCVQYTYFYYKFCFKSGRGIISRSIDHHHILCAPNVPVPGQNVFAKAVLKACITLNITPYHIDRKKTQLGYLHTQNKRKVCPPKLTVVRSGQNVRMSLTGFFNPFRTKR